MATTGNSRTTAPSQQDVHQPYNSLIFITILSILSPLATILWNFHHVSSQGVSNDDPIYDDYHYDGYPSSFSVIPLERTSGQDWAGKSLHDSRFLGEKCNIHIHDDDTPEEPDSWSSVQLTTLISGSVACLALLGFEIFRRDPIVGKYVYDRKRLSQPNRTPPPLMLSRSLWRGHENETSDEDENGSDKTNRHTNNIRDKRKIDPCVRPAIFELLFLSLDDNYIRYSRAADEARKERERLGYSECCRTGCYHENCCNKRRRFRSIKEMESLGNEDDVEYVDEDGYVFYPGYHHCCSFDQREEDHVDSPIESREKSRVDAGKNRRIMQRGRGWNLSIVDLFPEDSNAVQLQSINGSTWPTRPEPNVDPVDVLTAANSYSEKKIDHSIDEPLKDESDLPEGHGPSESVTAVVPSISNNREEKVESSSSMSGDVTKEKIENRGLGISMHDADKDGVNDVAGGICGQCEVERNENEGLADEYTTSLMMGSDDNDHNDQRHQTERLIPDNDRTVKHISETALEEEETDKLQEKPTESSANIPLKYPLRIKHFFIPPGFHVWTNAFEYVRHFFTIQSLKRRDSRTKTFFPRQNSSSSENGSTKNTENRPRFQIHTQSVPLTSPEKELLRCAGLDTYLLIRFARFGFDVTFYPFLAACVTVLPIYESCKNLDSRTPDEDGDGMVSTAKTTNEGYFSLTINRVGEGSNKMVWIFIFSIIYYLYILRRLWFEWEVVIKLRHHFLANGDDHFHHNPKYLQKFRNTCIVESVPKTHRSDRNLWNVFENLFPGQIKRAEMLIDTSKLEDIVDQRLHLIEKYESIGARYRYECWKYKQSQKAGRARCSLFEVAKPKEPQVLVNGLCFGKRENAISYYRNKIDELNELAENEYAAVVEKRLKWRDISLLESQESPSPVRYSQFSIDDMYSLFIPKEIREALGLEQPDAFCETGFVEFKSIAAKQSAVQCNIAGEPYWMVTEDAPDPRDFLWSNICASYRTIRNRKALVQFMLMLGILTWGAFVTLVSNAATNSLDNIGEADPFGGVDEEKNFIVGFLRGYLPAFIVSQVLLWLPNLFFYIAINIIRLKSLSEVDEFVLKWNTGYRIANVFFSFFSLSFYEAFKCLKEDPDNFVKRLSEGVLRQSQFLLNLIIIATGQETMLQLLQWRSLIKQAFFRPLINLNVRSKRYRNWLNEAPDLERGFIFGFFAPALSYGLLVAMMYSFMVPIIMGVCSLFFWIATKVHTHNALFVYCQPCEGGGKIFYYWNRIVFISLYVSIIIFSSILGLRKHAAMAVSFLIVMSLITYIVDESIKRTFIVHSLNLPMKIARIHDEEEEALIAKSNITQDGGELFMYRQPILNQANWETKPFWR